VMDKKRLSIIVIVVFLVLLIAGSLIYQKSVEKDRKIEEKKAAEPVRITKEVEDERREVEIPKEPEIPEEVVPVEKPEPTEPIAVAPVTPPVSTPDCIADSPKVTRQRSSASPEGMVYVPGGVFTMGSSTDTGHADEGPVHGVCLSGFYMDKYEITNAQFEKFVEATGYVTDAEKNASPEDVHTWRHPYGPDSDAQDMPNHPVVCVNWNDANAYAKWAGKRLPTEAEWEKASRGTDGRIYPWGNLTLMGASANIADKSAGLRWSDNSVDDNYKMAAVVGSFPDGKSVYGVEDIAGNVWEWCYDWWGKNYYAASPSQNPIGPEIGEFRVIRGGSWFYTADGARSAQRMYFRPLGTSNAIGFRCVKDAG
jgi:formylglycine-generating enzyme required for sulfatase activity